MEHSKLHGENEALFKYHLHRSMEKIINNFTEKNYLKKACIIC